MTISATHSLRASSTAALPCSTGSVPAMGCTLVWQQHCDTTCHPSTPRPMPLECLYCRGKSPLPRTRNSTLFLPLFLLLFFSLKIPNPFQTDIRGCPHSPGSQQLLMQPWEQSAGQLYNNKTNSSKILWSHEIYNTFNNTKIEI